MQIKSDAHRYWVKLLREEWLLKTKLISKRFDFVQLCQLILWPKTSWRWHLTSNYEKQYVVSGFDLTLCEKTTPSVSKESQGHVRRTCDSISNRLLGPVGALATAYSDI
jgi:hypothetical protein